MKVLAGKIVLVGKVAPFLGLVLSVIGCGQSKNTQHAVSPEKVSRYVVEAEPDGAVAVGEARKTVQGEQLITLIGTIGGSSEPFVEGLAAFTIVDRKVPYCSADEGCPTPWDYCCTQDQVKDNIATVKIVDQDGIPVAEDARELLGVIELSTVVVKGKAERDDHGNLTLAASEVFVRE
ncbi:hypothetical protein [Novipirellula artificiosorum]|uniref:Uncharacterized protein n=1 Tax=Novipirellula artificiosorum TaxID=2528016 RepID=A0A5C6DDQ5_9BACT|nr:hypothetical protein [Novipirellula artificiosorum]TWU34315.1 hypothetical protein Poly41_44620 [Novipirellula artificiosorum]